MLVVTSIVLLASCNRDEEPIPIDFGYDYLPLKVGSWTEYSVDSIVFNDFTATVDTFSFFLKDTCIGVFTDLENRQAYHYEQFKRLTDTSEWQYQTSYSLVTTSTRTERLENNLRTVVFAYPPRESKGWDINAFNANGTQNAEFLSVDQSFTIGDYTSDSAAHAILLEDTNNFITKRFSEERYARGVGLVYKQYYHIETQFNIDSGLLWRQTIREPFQRID